MLRLCRIVTIILFSFSSIIYSQSSLTRNLSQVSLVAGTQEWLNNNNHSDDFSSLHVSPTTYSPLSNLEGITRDIKKLTHEEKRQLFLIVRTTVELQTAPGSFSAAPFLGPDEDPSTSSDQTLSLRRQHTPIATWLRRWGCCACAGTAIAMSLAANLIATGFVAFIASDLLDSSKTCSSRLNLVSGYINYGAGAIDALKHQCPNGFGQAEKTAEDLGIDILDLANNMCTGKCS